MKGLIKFYNVAKRFGFIIPDNGSDDLYFAESSLPRTRRYDPVEGDRVEFEVRDTVGKSNRLAVQIEVDQSPALDFQYSAKDVERLARAPIPNAMKPNGGGV